MPKKQKQKKKQTEAKRWRGSVVAHQHIAINRAVMLASSLQPAGSFSFLVWPPSDQSPSQSNPRLPLLSFTPF